MLSFWPFCSGVVPSPSPCLSLRARLHKGSLLPHCFLLPSKAAVVLVVPRWGWSHFPGRRLPPSAGGIVAERSLVTLFLCLSQLWGPARQPLAVVVAARAAVSRWDSFLSLHKPTASGFSLGENGGPVVGRVAGGSVQGHQQPHAGCGTFLSGPGLDVAPAHPRGACVAHGGAAARPCLWEAVAAPRTPLSKTPSVLQRAPHPGEGLNPQVPPCKAVATLEQGRCCLVPLGAGRGISGHTGAAPRSRSRGRSSAGHRHRCLAPPPTGCPSPASSCSPLAKLLG